MSKIMSSEECFFNNQFEIVDWAIGTYDDNGTPQCMICKNWSICRGREILQEMEDYEKEVLSRHGH